MDGIHFHNSFPAMIPPVQHQKSTSRNGQATIGSEQAQLTVEAPKTSNDSAAIAPLPVPNRMEMQYHEELGQVVVKVIDRQTDKVIEELPSQELQKTKLSIRQAIGLIIDEEA